MLRFIPVLMIILSSGSLNAQTWKPDVLGAGFVQSTIQQPDDYEGKVTCTVVKKVPFLNVVKTAVLYVHGFNDYFFQKEMADSFSLKGFRFYALDIRKYGRSYLPNQKFNNVRNLNEYFADLDTALKIMRNEGAEKILLCGHSTGGLIVALYANENLGKELFDAVYLNSPFFDMNLSPFLEKRILPSVVKKGAKKPNKLMKGGISKWYGISLYKGEKGEWDYNLAWKPHVPPSVNYGWLKAIRDGQLKLQSGIIIDKPVLVMHSNNSVYTKKWTEDLHRGDAVLSVDDIATYAKRLQGDVTAQVIGNGMHDLVLSPMAVRQKVYRQLFLWVDGKLK